MKILKAIFAHGNTDLQRLRICSKKSVQQGRSYFDGQSVLALREHGTLANRQYSQPNLATGLALLSLQQTMRGSSGERAGTPLAAFFNVPTRGIT